MHTRTITIALLAGLATIASLLFAAEAPVTTTETYLARIQTDPNSGPAPVATAFFGRTTTIDGVKYEAPWTSVSWPLAAPKTVTVEGVTLTYAQVSAFVTAIAYAEKAAAETPAPAAP